jgi:hypothetical protein
MNADREAEARVKEIHRVKAREAYLFKIVYRVLEWAEVPTDDAEAEIADLVMLELLNIKEGGVK